MLLVKGSPLSHLVNHQRLFRGASVADLQTAGRWQSPQILAHYAKAELVEQSAVAQCFPRKAK